MAKGFYFAQSDIKPEASFAVYPGHFNETVQAVSLIDLMKLIGQEK